MPLHLGVVLASHSGSAGWLESFRYNERLVYKGLPLIGYKIIYGCNSVLGNSNRSLYILGTPASDAHLLIRSEEELGGGYSKSLGDVYKWNLTDAEHFNPHGNAKPAVRHIRISECGPFLCILFNELLLRLANIR